MDYTSYHIDPTCTTNEEERNGLYFLSYRFYLYGIPRAFSQVKKQARIWMYWYALKCWLFGQGCEEEEKIILSPKK
jgi:hypothetical protein